MKTPKTAFVTYSGGFHNSSELRLRVKVITRNGCFIGVLSEGQQKKLDNHFCGIDGCTCGATARADCDLGHLDSLE